MTAVDADRLLELADTDPEAMFALFEQHGWGDGLPLVPPTPERVDAMLEHGEGDPDEQLAVLPPRSGIVTRRIVAVNAVLAGCPADVFPVVLSAVRALAHPDVNLRGVNATTHPVAPLLIVSGDVVKQCGFNFGTGAFGPGNRANATVGTGRPPDDAARRRRAAGLGRRVDARVSRRSTPTAWPRTSTRAHGSRTRAAVVSTRRARSRCTAVRVPTTCTTWKPTVIPR